MRTTNESPSTLVVVTQRSVRHHEAAIGSVNGAGIGAADNVDGHDAGASEGKRWVQWRAAIDTDEPINRLLPM